MLWYCDESYNVPMPMKLAEDIGRFYGKTEDGPGYDFAQMLAGYLEGAPNREIMQEALDEFYPLMDGYCFKNGHDWVNTGKCWRCDVNKPIQ